MTIEQQKLHDLKI